MLGRWRESIHRILNRKVGALLQPGKDQIEQLLHGLRAMIAGDLLMQTPPRTLNRIRHRRIGGEVREHQPMAPPAEMALRGLTIIDAGIVTDDMDFSVT